MTGQPINKNSLRWTILLFKRNISSTHLVSKQMKNLKLKDCAAHIEIISNLHWTIQYLDSEGFHETYNMYQFPLSQWHAASVDSWCQSFTSWTAYGKFFSYLVIVNTHSEVCFSVLCIPWCSSMWLAIEKQKGAQTHFQVLSFSWNSAPVGVPAWHQSFHTTGL